MRNYNDMAEDLGSTDREEFTGRSIVLFKSELDTEGKAAGRMQSLLHDKAGIRNVASSLDMSVDTFDADALAGSDAFTLPRLGIAVLPGQSDAQAAALANEVADPSSEIEAVIPEKLDHLFSGNGSNLAEAMSYPGLTADRATEFTYNIDPSAIRRLAKMLRLLSDVCDALKEPETPTSQSFDALATRFSDTVAATWGLLATRVTTSRYSGRGVRIAVIDTGMDVDHRDFRGRRIVTRVFAPPGTGPRPTNPHGTHCIGTACGPRTPSSGPRYGIAYESEIFALKVFNDDPRRPVARRGDVLTAMDFANRAGCQILSLSLGSGSNGAVDPEYSRAITRLRRAGSLTVAAAGNEGRQGFRVSSPASSPDAVAVAAVDQNLRRADFSCFGPLDISGPGVDILSSVIGGGTRRLSGTSMATPHVAGIAALWLQANPGWTADQLELAIRRTALALSQPASHVGAGLVQAPQ